MSALFFCLFLLYNQIEIIIILKNAIKQDKNYYVLGYGSCFSISFRFCHNLA